MKDSLRRALIFLVTVGAGTFFVFADLPLIIMIPLLVITGLALLILMGSITGADIKAISFRRKGAVPGKGAAAGKGAVKEPAKAKKPPAPVKRKGIAGALGSLVQGLKGIRFRPLGKAAREKKIREIDQKLEATLKPQKVSDVSAKTGSAAAAAGGGGSAAPSPAEGEASEEDPFLSLTGEDLDVGLLDELDEEETPAALPGGLPREELPTPPAGVAEGEEAAPGEPGEEPGESGEPGGAGAIDEELAGLDEIDLDAMEIEEEEEFSPAGTAAPSSPAKPQEPAAAKPEPKKVELNIGFDGALMQEKIPEQIDVATITGPTGTDDEMLSILAAEAKIGRQMEADSLLRDLKDFKAPAKEIEEELRDVVKLFGNLPGKKEPRKGQPEKVREAEGSTSDE